MTEARPSSLRFDWLFTSAALLFATGMALDAWAHGHLDLSGEGFFTPFHAVMYAGFLLTAGSVVWATRRNARAGVPLRFAAPAGYGTSLAGIALFAISGVGDLLWHTFFGVEQGLAGLVSATHIFLFFSGGLLVLGPVRAAVLRGGSPSLRDLLPALIVLGFFLTSLSFQTNWTFDFDAAADASPFVRFAPIPPNAAAELTFFAQSHGVLSVLAHAAVIAGVILYQVHRLPWRFGAITVVLAVNGAFAGIMHYGYDPRAFGLVFAPALLAGLVGDWAVRRLQPLDAGLWRTQAIGFLVPFAYFCAVFAVTGALGGGFWWEIHEVSGTVVMSGFAGALLATLAGPHVRRALAPA